MPLPETALKDFSAVIITGGSSGIGKSIIELCGKLRPDISFCNLSRRAPVMGNNKLKLRHVACDLSDPAQLWHAQSEIEDFLKARAPTGKILLVNNSGFGLYGRFPEPSVERQLEMVDVNVRAVVQLTGNLLPTLKARGGAVVTIASTTAFQPTPYFSTYGASKAFVLHWSLGLSQELRGTGVHALAVCPGPTSTGFAGTAGLKEDSSDNFLGQTSDQVALATLRALASGRTLVVSGWTNKVMMAASSKLPKALAARVASLVLEHYRLKQVKP